MAQRDKALLRICWIHYDWLIGVLIASSPTGPAQFFPGTKRIAFSVVSWRGIVQVEFKAGLTRQKEKHHGASCN
jgi:hypothetical protein